MRHDKQRLSSVVKTLKREVRAMDQFLFMCRAVRAEEDLLPHRSRAGVVGVHLASHHGMQPVHRKKGAGWPDACLCRVRRWGKENQNGPRAGQLVVAQEFCLSRRVLCFRRKKGRINRGYSPRCGKNWESCPRKSTSATEKLLPQAKKMETMSPKDGLERWKVSKQEIQGPMAGAFFLAVNKFFMWW